MINSQQLFDEFEGSQKFNQSQHLQFRKCSQSDCLGPWNSLKIELQPKKAKLYQTKFNEIIKKNDYVGKNNVKHHSNDFQSGNLITKRFKTHVFQFVDSTKIHQIHSLEKIMRPCTLRQFDSSVYLPEKREMLFKQPLEPTFIALFKHKKKLLNKRYMIKQKNIKQRGNQSSHASTMPSITDKSHLQFRKSKVVNLGYQKLSTFRIRSLHEKTSNL